MSIQYGITCLDCKVDAPGIGDGGFLGDPGLAKPGESPPSMKGPNPSFGYFYDAFVGVGIRTYELECLHAFLIAHDGHRLFLSADHDDPKDWPAEVRELPDERYDWERDGTEREQRVTSGEFVNATYEISCPTCGRSLSSEAPELLRAMEPFTIDVEAAAIFVERWGSTPDTGWNHRLGGIADPWDPLMEQLVAFVTAHSHHGLRARLRV